MGVLNCSRKGCDNIMCHTYVDSVGYVCYDCQVDFKNYFGGKKNQTEENMLKRLKEFMNKEKKIYHSQEVELTVEDFFSKYSR